MCLRLLKKIELWPIFVRIKIASCPVEHGTFLRVKTISHTAESGNNFVRIKIASYPAEPWPILCEFK